MGQILPLGVLALFTALAAAPWVATGEELFGIIAAFLPAVVTHYWALRRASVLPETAVLFSGLCVDIVTGGPLGMWTSVYALAWVIGLVQRRWAELMWKPGRWVLFAVAMVILAFGVYGLGAVFASPVASAGTLFEAVVWLIAAYPLLAALLRLADGWRTGRPLEST